jgi:hypothetical protein
MQDGVDNAPSACQRAGRTAVYCSSLTNGRSLPPPKKPSKTPDGDLSYTKKVIDRVSPVVASYNRSYMKTTGLTTALLLILLLLSPTRPVAFDPDLRQPPPSPPPFSYAY